MVPVSIDQLREMMLNSEEAMEAYETADSESRLIEALYEMREHAKLNKSELATLLGITPSALVRLENAPRSASIKTLERYAKACGASINICISYK
ncbi:helix-turn-helix transcriptional regulator (plasmid) [Rouxiella badensis]|uniref:Transcriptional regulator n=1 Tax=Rouxiella badensis TaxID=1646377 RepID=A0A1X0WAW4_9GAMM|nr:helix-turn-helix transcriptional regulator [Rouxiella badensis]ORJ23928.1 transcriptional regulator [Rouxiella badensis]WAT03178.1 helix-turn-helix transcriptional regulator [Rouxiella badensis]WAT03302.1 helix-turn-helix transcriptional regulator [Rouxiella badensis]